jgi:serine/threonine protein kinase
MGDEEFLQRAVEMRFLTPGKADEARRVLKEIQSAGLELTAYDVCLRRRLLTLQQVDQIVAPEERTERKRFGPYTVLAKLGEGGMGSVYKALRDGDPQSYALKILPRKFASDPELHARFRREAKIACALTHPNLVRGLDSGELHGRLYYAMEYVDGVLLSDVIDQRGPIGEKAALQIGLQVASALVEIDSRGLVHRDVKPDNIVIDRQGVAKLMDLGLMKHTIMDVTTLTKTGFTVGTPYYMSYEQIMGRKDIDIRADIYSLGATLYHMVTGRAPFEDLAVMELLEKFQSLKLTDPRTVQPDLSEGFCMVLSRMIAKDRRDRYGTPREVLDDLNRVHDGLAPKTRPLAAMAPPKKKAK